MDFVLWVSRTMHAVSVTVWLGGMIALNAVIVPVLRNETGSRDRVSTLVKRFMPFVWFSLWTLFFTGLFLAILSPRPIMLDFSTMWSALLFIKGILFVVTIFFSWQTKKVLERIDKLPDGEEVAAWFHTLETVMRRSALAGLAAVLCAAGMGVA